MFLGLKVSAGLQSARLFSALLFGRCESLCRGPFSKCFVDTLKVGRKKRFNSLLNAKWSQSLALSLWQLL